MPVRSSYVLLAAIGLAVGCSNAKPDAKGGEARFDASPPVVDQPSPPNDSGADGGACDSDSEKTATWTALYGCFFGPGSGAFGGCAGNGQCHGAVGQAGEQASAFVCADKAGCLSSMKGNSGLAIAGTPGDQTVLFGVIRKRSPATGFMPKSTFSQYTFSENSVQRLVTWINAGAKDD